jgi:tRNA (adenine37-N6)-methyltransferase
MEITMNDIGSISAKRGYAVKLKAEYAPGLIGLQGFSHVMVLWYASKSPEWDANGVTMEKPYRGAPERMGIFATRSSIRPNGTCVSVAAVSSVDAKKGEIKLWWIDAEDGTPVLDVKPYYLCSEYARDASYPEWCADWPQCLEDSASFAWDKVFLF